MLRKRARGWRIYFQIFFAVAELRFRRATFSVALYLLDFRDIQVLAGWGRSLIGADIAHKNFSLVSRRRVAGSPWCGLARRREVVGRGGGGARSRIDRSRRESAGVELRDAGRARAASHGLRLPSKRLRRFSAAKLLRNLPSKLRSPAHSATVDSVEDAYWASTFCMHGLAEDHFLQNAPLSETRREPVRSARERPTGGPQWSTTLTSLWDNELCDLPKSQRHPATGSRTPLLDQCFYRTWHTAANRCRRLSAG